MSDLRRDMAEALHNIYKIRKPRALSMAGHLFYCTGISDELANLAEQNKHLEQSLSEHKAMVRDLVNTIHDLMLWFDTSTVRQEQAKEDAFKTLTKAKQLQENTK